MAPPLILALSELSPDHVTAVGRKAAHLGVLKRLGLPVPQGFALGVAQHEQFLAAHQLTEQLESRLVGLDPDALSDTAHLHQLSRELRELIRAPALSAALRDELGQHYARLCKSAGADTDPGTDADALPVAVRSSGLRSMPGQLDTHLNVQGLEQLERSLKAVWASAYTDRAIAYRLAQGLPTLAPPMGVCVLELVDAHTAGVVLTRDPTAREADAMIIESVWGLGPGVVEGTLSPDRFLVDRESGAITSHPVARTEMVSCAAGGGTTLAPVPAADRNRPSLQPEEVAALARTALEIEAHFGTPQDLEWAFAREPAGLAGLRWLQAREAHVIQTARDDTHVIADLMAQMFRRKGLGET